MMPLQGASARPIIAVAVQTVESLLSILAVDTVGFAVHGM